MMIETLENCEKNITNYLWGLIKHQGQHEFKPITITKAAGRLSVDRYQIMFRCKHCGMRVMEEANDKDLCSIGLDFEKVEKAFRKGVTKVEDLDGLYYAS